MKVLQLIRDFGPWAMSFPFFKVLICAVVAALMCFGGYVFLSGEKAKVTVAVQKREGNTLQRLKAAVDWRIRTDSKVQSLTHDEKIKELGKWAVPTKKE